MTILLTFLQLLLGPFAPADPPQGQLVVEVPDGQTVVVRDRPAGRVVARLPARTEFGSPRALTVMRREDGWLGVTTTAVSNERLGWIDPATSSLDYRHTRLELEADLSERTLTVRERGQVSRRVAVTVGGPASPTPIGRFAVTDKLRGADYGSYYGCCILAISGRQPTLPPGWRGGDLLAIHGGPTWAIGGALSAGFLHAGEADLRWLMRRVPLGTPITIHP